MNTRTNGNGALRLHETQHIQKVIDATGSVIKTAQILELTPRTIYIRINSGEFTKPPAVPFGEVDGRTLEQVRIEFMRDVVWNTKSLAEASKVSGVSVKTLYNWLDPYQLKVPPRGDKVRSDRIRNPEPTPNKRILKHNREDGRDVCFSVDPDERDYYYNLDYLCGTYHQPKKQSWLPVNGGTVKEPHHALGYGED